MDIPVKVGADRGEQLSPQHPACVLRGRYAVHQSSSPQSVHQLFGRTHSHIRDEERVLDLCPCLVIERVPGQQCKKTAAERGLRAREPRPKPDQAAGRGLRQLDWRRLDSLLRRLPVRCLRGENDSRGLGHRRDVPPASARHEQADSAHDQDDNADEDVKEKIHSRTSLSERRRNGSTSHRVVAQRVSQSWRTRPTAHSFARLVSRVHPADHAEGW